MALKIAILGCGGVGRGYHAPAFARVEGVENVAACDIIEKRARALAEDYGVPWYRDAVEMLEAMRRSPPPRRSPPVPAPPTSRAKQRASYCPRPRSFPRSAKPA